MFFCGFLVFGFFSKNVVFGPEAKSPPPPPEKQISGLSISSKHRHRAPNIPMDHKP